MSDHPSKPDPAPRKPIRTQIRWAIRLILLATTVACMLPTVATGRLMILVPALSPFLALSSILTTRAIALLHIIGLVVAFIALFRHRFLCRWICPAGTCLDAVSALGRRCGRPPAHPLPIGRCLLVLTIGGAALGFPLALWCDPLALFAGSFVITRTGQSSLALIPLIASITLLIISFLSPHIFCRALCPLGALQDQLAAVTSALRKTAALIARPATDPGERQKPSPLLLPIKRRTIIGLTAGAASAGLLRHSTNVEATPPLRPPGAVDELAFRGLCSRCGNCIRTCPSRIIRRDSVDHGLTALLTPTLTFEQDYCREDCVRCTQACPSGALAPITLTDKPNIRLGRPRVDMTVCLLGDDRDCSACRRWCPYEAIRYVFDEIQYCLIPVIDPDTCNGCGACEKACPTTPVKAVRVHPIIPT